MQWFPGDDLLAATRPRGLPIGNQTSQFWANVYLNELDQFVKQTLHCPAYLRYCDDLLLFADDKPTLHGWRREIEQFLVGLRLKIHPDKTSIYPVGNGIPFLGFQVFPDHRRLERANGVRFQRRVRPLLQRYAREEKSIWSGSALRFMAGSPMRRTATPGACGDGCCAKRVICRP